MLFGYNENIWGFHYNGLIIFRLKCISNNNLTYSFNIFLVFYNDGIYERNLNYNYIEL